MIPVTDTLLVYEKELKHSKAIPLKTTGIRIIKMEPFDSTHYLIINNAWKIKLLNKHTGEITDSPFGESSMHTIYIRILPDITGFPSMGKE